jgi:transposase-like protein
MNTVAAHFVLVTECPKCDYSPVHHRKVAYPGHIDALYKCSICKHEFSVKHRHQVRGVTVDVDTSH